jgi:hypothetical protein
VTLTYKSPCNPLGHHLKRVQGLFVFVPLPVFAGTGQKSKAGVPDKSAGLRKCDLDVALNLQFHYSTGACEVG